MENVLIFFFYIEKGWCTPPACGVIILMGAFILLRERKKEHCILHPSLVVSFSHSPAGY